MRGVELLLVVARGMEVLCCPCQSSWLSLIGLVALENEMSMFSILEMHRGSSSEGSIPLVLKIEAAKGKS